MFLIGLFKKSLVFTQKKISHCIFFVFYIQIICYFVTNSLPHFILFLSFTFSPITLTSVMRPLSMSVSFDSSGKDLASLPCLSLILQSMLLDLLVYQRLPLTSCLQVIAGTYKLVHLFPPVEKRSRREEGLNAVSSASHLRHSGVTLAFCQWPFPFRKALKTEKLYSSLEFPYLHFSISTFQHPFIILTSLSYSDYYIQKFFYLDYVYTTSPSPNLETVDFSLFIDSVFQIN